MAMNYGDKIITSVYGRRLGLQNSSSGQFGTSKRIDLLVGPDAFRSLVTTETTATNLSACGISKISGSSAASSSVFTLDPPIPGVDKTLWFTSTGDKNCYVKTANSETFQSTMGSSFTTLQCTAGGLVRLVAVSTAIWLASITSGTSSQGGGILQTTTT